MKTILKNEPAVFQLKKRNTVNFEHKYRKDYSILTICFVA